MEEGSVLTGAGNGKASDSRSLVVEIGMDKMPEHYGGANEKLLEVSGSGFTRIMEKESCSSWVVEMAEESARWSGHSIYRVPQFMKDMTNSEAYSPRFVSLGPLHHGEPQLLPMEDHKRRAVLHMVNRSGKPAQEFVAAIDEVADELQAAYNDLDDKWRGANKGRFVEMMVADGCFLLELMRIPEITMQADLNDLDYYATNDPIFSVRSYVNLWPITRRDMIAMENQLPLVVLQRLLAVERSTSPSAREINKMVLDHLDLPHFEEGMNDLSLHFLDIFHKSYCGISPGWKRSNKFEPRTPCAIELSEAGIQFRKSKTKNIHDIDFKNGVLSMPLFKIDDNTEADLLNLMAFEWLHPDDNFYDVAWYVSFVDKIIVSERDAALLRSQGIIANMIGSDKKVAEMFNILTKLARTPMPGSKLGDVICKVNSHCKKRWNPQKWRATFMNTYLSNPWVFISTVAAFILLVAALLQTVYTVVLFYTRKG